MGNYGSPLIMANGYKEISVSISERLLGRLDLYFYDPRLGKPSYGARSQLITELLENWLEGKTNVPTRAAPPIESGRGGGS